MTTYYELIKLVHITAVTLSGGLFALRGLLLNLGQDWVMAPPVRRLASAIDTVLLAAAVTLTTIIGEYPFVDAWLTAKILLLLVYIALGFLAFWKARTRPMRLLCWLMALAVYAFILTIALTHDPRGIFAM